MTRSSAFRAAYGTSKRRERVTTQVKILNEGPNAVKIEVQGRDEGRFVQVDEKVLEPNKFASVYIHASQSFQVSEVKED